MTILPGKGNPWLAALGLAAILLIEIAFIVTVR